MSPQLASAPPVPLTCYQTIQDAYFEAGKIGLGEEPKSEMLVNGMRRLNQMINYFQTRGIKLWVQQDVSIAAPVLQTGVGVYTMGPTGTVVLFSKPRRVIESYYTDLTANRRPLTQILSRNEWDTLSTTTQKGQITSIYVDKQLGNLVINVWMVPDLIAAQGQLHLITDMQIPNVSMLNDQMFFPPEWSFTLMWGLAYQVSTGQPQEVIEKCKYNADKYQEELEGWDVEDAPVTFQPDPRGAFVGRRFNK